MRQYFAASVERSPALHLIGSVGTVAQALTVLGSAGERVDVLLVDLGLPDGSGLEVIRHARQHHPDCEAMVISMFGDEQNVISSIEAGALGYIHKDAAPSDIALTIMEMKSGASPISPMIARKVLAKYASSAAPSNVPVIDETLAGGTLTRREMEVLNLIARGFSYIEIAKLENRSVHTVQAHVKKIYSKLSVHSKIEAVYEATRLGLLPEQMRAKVSR